MDPIPLNTVRAAVGTAGNAVTAPVADITGAAADARAALAGAVADTAIVAADSWAALADAADTTVDAADVAAAADSAGATYTVALAASASIAASTPPALPALPAASAFETSGQGMAAVGSVKDPVELFHADEATLQVTQTEICFQCKIPFLGSIRRGETIQDSTANLLLCDFNTVRGTSC